MFVLGYLLNLVHLKKNMAEIVLRFFKFGETASGNVVFVGKYMERFDICTMDLLSGFD